MTSFCKDVMSQYKIVTLISMEDDNMTLQCKIFRYDITFKESDISVGM